MGPCCQNGDSVFLFLLILCLDSFYLTLMRILFKRFAKFKLFELSDEHRCSTHLLLRYSEKGTVYSRLYISPTPICAIKRTAIVLSRLGRSGLSTWKYRYQFSYDH